MITIYALYLWAVCFGLVSDESEGTFKGRKVWTTKTGPRSKRHAKGKGKARW